MKSTALGSGGINSRITSGINSGINSGNIVNRGGVRPRVSEVSLCMIQ